jgi:hypothetical protein
MFSRSIPFTDRQSPALQGKGSCVPCMSIMQRTLVVSCRKRSKIQIFFYAYKTSVQIFPEGDLPAEGRKSLIHRGGTRKY